MNEGFVRRNKSVAARQQIAFEHSLDSVLAEHLDDASVRSQFAAVCILWKIIGNPKLLADRIDFVQLVRCVLVGTEDSEIPHVETHDVSQERAQRTRVLYFYSPRFRNLHAVLPKVWKMERSL